ncbi:MAG: MarR family transcriptional regulator [Parvibaculaceae bacterium]|nr:MarR family transcriptional regulator [Parvibaculaceae bacterium]
MTSREKAFGIRAVITLYREFEQVARDQDISLTQYRTLLYLSNGSKRAGAIAAAGAVKKPTISAMLNNLRQKDWIAEEADPDDGRATQIVLTEQGRARMRAFEDSLAERIDQLLPGFDLPAFYMMMDTLYHALAASKEQRLKDVERRFLE